MQPRVVFAVLCAAGAAAGDVDAAAAKPAFVPLHRVVDVTVGGAHRHHGSRGLAASGTLRPYSPGSDFDDKSSVAVARLSSLGAAASPKEEVERFVGCRAAALVLVVSPSGVSAAERETYQWFELVVGRGSRDTPVFVADASDARVGALLRDLAAGTEGGAFEDEFVLLVRDDPPPDAGGLDVPQRLRRLTFSGTAYSSADLAEATYASFVPSLEGWTAWWRGAAASQAAVADLPYWTASLQSKIGKKKSPAPGEEKEAAEGTRTFIIAANIDTMTAVPTFPKRNHQDGSALAVLLELARIFSKTTADNATGTVQIHFLLGSSRTVSYPHVKHYLQSNPHVARSADYCLYLEDLIPTADGSPLYLHEPLVKSQKRKGDSDQLPLAGALKAAFRAANVAVEEAVSEVDYASHEVPWGSYHFAHKGVRAASLSFIAPDGPAVGQLLRYNGLGSARSLAENAAAVARVADALAEAILALSGAAAGAGAKADPFFVEAVLNFTAGHPRVPMAVQTPHGQAVLAAVKGLFVSHTGLRLKEESHPLPNPDSIRVSPLPLEARIIRSKPITFDLLCSVVIASCLAILFLLFRPNAHVPRQP
ncbi:hypothetical protein DIPPA_08611 [Diplonema papillatum]|nr:hypothetical protein DIPPA_08611 [Diplonema papillatum]